MDKKAWIAIVLLIASFAGYEYYTGGMHRAYIDHLTQDNNLVVIEYGADWCPYCKRLNPVLGQLEQLGLMKVVHVNTDEKEQVFYGVLIPAIPQISIYRKTYDGEIGLIYHGFVPATKAEFANLLFGGTPLNKSQVDKINEALAPLYPSATKKVEHAI